MPIEKIPTKPIRLRMSEVWKARTAVATSCATWAMVMTAGMDRPGTPNSDRYGAVPRKKN